jgi:hypothetical protein
MRAVGKTHREVNRFGSGALFASGWPGRLLGPVFKN